MSKTKYLNAFEQSMVVGAMRTGLSASRTAMLLTQTGAPGSYHHIRLPIHTLNDTHTQSMSQLCQGLKILL